MNLNFFEKNQDGADTPPVAPTNTNDMSEGVAKENPGWWRSLSVISKISVITGLVILLFASYIVFSLDKFGAAVSVVGQGEVGKTELAVTYLDFGNISPGMIATRRMNIKNDGIISIRVIVLTGGDLSSYIKVSKSNFKLKAGTETDIEYTVEIPTSFSAGTTIFGKVTLIKTPIF